MLRKATFPRVLFPQQIQSLQMMSKLHFHRIFGYYLGQRFAWLIIDLNFTDIVPDQCSADDYIQWTPTDGVSRTSGSACAVAVALLIMHCLHIGGHSALHLQCVYGIVVVCVAGLCCFVCDLYLAVVCVCIILVAICSDL